MNEEERKAIDWLKNKPQECTDIIRSCSNLQNKKAYAKDRTMYKALISFIEKQNKKMIKALDFINDENNFFEDGENWQNVLKIKKILEEN